MDWVQIIELLKQAGDTKTALVLVAIVCFYIGSRLQKRLEQFALKKEVSDSETRIKADLSNHKARVYGESLVLEGNVTGTLEKFSGNLTKHEEKDDKRFEALDEKMTPRLDNMDKKVNTANLALSRIQTKMQIEVPKEEM